MEMTLDKKSIRAVTEELRKRWLTTAEAAKYLGIRKGDLLSMINDGMIPATSGIGKGRKIDIRDLDELMNSLKVRKESRATDYRFNNRVRLLHER